jgi:hypothetical protein
MCSPHRDLQLFRKSQNRYSNRYGNIHQIVFFSEFFFKNLYRANGASDEKIFNGIIYLSHRDLQLCLKTQNRYSNSYENICQIVEFFTNAEGDTNREDICR